MIIPTPEGQVAVVQLAPVLVLRTRLDFEVQVESTVGVAEFGREGCRYSVGEIPGEVGRQLTGNLRGARATEIGTLQLDFESGVTLLAFADPVYEAWSIVASGGFRVVCMPGGELAVWQEVDDSGLVGRDQAAAVRTPRPTKEIP
ncbi:DUF6188 family protein [Nocardia sp. NPDC024068]|uniref:DUF6188 family protein n=1 Tax=Nocardia sp. NPDC024068 TaxID=3157197 RepID=UPI0033C30873